MLEALINLYYVHTDKGLDMSEQQILDCSYNAACERGFTDYVGNYLRDDGVIDEEHYPWQDQQNSCDYNQISDSEYQITIARYIPVSTSNIDLIKESIITRGPLVASLSIGHAMALIGFGTIQEGDNYPYNGGNIIVGPNNSNIGKLYWIFKDSYSPKSGHGGYSYYQQDQCNFIKIDKYLPPFEGVPTEMLETRECYDKDSDGYCFWGIGNMADCDNCEDCPTDPADEDSDDSNPRIGPYEADYSGTPVAPEMEVKLYKEWLCNDVVENGDFFYVENACFLDNQILEFKITNNGNAQLNLSPVGNVVSLSGPDENEFVVELQPPRKIKFNSQSSFKIKYTGNLSETKTVVVTIGVLDVDVLDYQFAIILNGCQTATGIDQKYGIVNWNDPFKLVNKDIKINSGCILTITGDVAFTNEADIFVDRGGTLIIDGGRLTGSCENLWNGIDLWGDYRWPQLGQYQGTLRILNGGTIEFARCGVENAIFNNNRYEYTGGIVSVVNAVFKDNLIGIRFWPYHNYNPGTGQPMYNFSRLTNSEFVTTKKLYDLHSSPQCFVYMQEIEGIDIRGCTFHNELESSELDPGALEGKGLLSIESDYVVTNYCIQTDPPLFPCPEYKPCRFENLEYGIWAGYFTTSGSIAIRNSEFVNNITGIDLCASVSPEVTQNTFYVRKVEQVPFNEAVYCGLYLDNSTGYKVEENSFFTFMNEQQKEELVSVGLIINNSGEDNNEIYNNAFDGLYAGIIAQEVNRDREGIRGLQIKCNNFTNGIFDIALTKDLQSSGITGIAPDQGSGENDPTAPAGNIFTYVDPGENPESEGNYFNSCENITYWHHADANGYYIIPERHTPAPMVDPKPEEHGLKFVPDESCPSNLSGGGPGFIEEKSSMMIAGQKADSVQNLLSLLTDGGDTEGLLTDIQNSWPEEAYELYSGMISKSPYLSDTSMIKAIEKEDVLLPGMITDVLVANPQSAKSEKVMSSVDGRSNPLTDDQLADIGEGRFIIGAKESLESHHSRYTFLKDLSKNNLVRLFKQDTLSESPIDSVINILSMQTGLPDEYLKAFEYLKKGDSTYVINTLENIPQYYDLTVSQSNEHELYEDYFNLLLSLDTVNSVIFEMDSLEKSNVYQIMNSSSGMLKKLARNILIANDSLDYIRQILLPRPGLKSAKVRTWPVKRIQSENLMKIYPNPAKNLVIIEVRLKEEPTDSFMQIINNEGIIFDRIEINDQNDYIVLPITDLKPGTYFCNLINRGVNIETKQFIIYRF